MSRNAHLRGLAIILLGCSGPAAAQAGCPAIDFENYAIGTAITNQYPGVTFSVQTQSCSNAPTLFMRIAAPTGATSSGTRALLIDQGCPSFSIDYLRMVFDLPQNEVTFCLGIEAQTYSVRAYSTTSGGAGLLSTQSIAVATANTVVRFVRVSAAAGNLRRIEVQGGSSTFEAIDDLVFSSDSTPPQAEISSPGYGQCVCGTVQVLGRACDPDGAYDHDTLEYLKVDAPVGTDWTPAGTASSPQCSAGGFLYNWDTTTVADEGCYYLLLKVTNRCGLQSPALTVACIDRHFESLSIRSPAANAVLGGSVCFDGTITDNCFSQYTIRYRPAGGGNYSPVDPANPTYAPPGGVRNDPLATWNTRVGAAAVADGNYQIEAHAVDTCGNAATLLRNVIIDNTPPVAVITSPLACTHRTGVVQVFGTASDAHLAGWTLQYTGGDAHGWITINGGAGPVVGGLLGNWNTAGLRPCAYTLRLIVSDGSSVNCGQTTNQAEYLVDLDIGSCCDINRDGSGDGADVPPFVNCLLGFSGCP